MALFQPIKKVVSVNGKYEKNADLYFQLALVLIEAMKYGEAMRYMNKAYELGLDSAEFHHERVITGFDGNTRSDKRFCNPLAHINARRCICPRALGTIVEHRK